MRRPSRHALRACAMGLAVLTMSAVALAQISPGPLSKPHAGLDGNTNCYQCHGSQKGAMDARCLTCHGEIKWLREQHRGLHDRDAVGECAKCHPEHGGKDFALIQWTEGAAEKFDHRRTGWTLTGKHVDVECQKCHQAKFQVSPGVKLRPKTAQHLTWTGLEMACNTCHEDVHKTALGVDCAKCHATAGWKPATQFDHAKTAYPLTGKHQAVKCDDCHRAARLALPVDAQGATHPLFKPLAHNECSDCHKDPHTGRFGATCAKCHQTESFHTLIAGSFDHSKTRYPLRGLHQTVACAKCHDPKTAWGPKPAFATCTACHKDPHAGQATLAGKPVDCAACHNEQNWRPSTYSVAQHAQSAYPLAGKHAAVECAKCHVKNPPAIRVDVLGKAGVLIRARHTACMDCHKDAHAGQLALRTDKGACESCHTVDGFKPSRFGAKEHAGLRLALEGKHATIECATCHAAVRPGLRPLPTQRDLGTAKVALKLDEKTCADCHRDAHGGQLKTAKCETCHDARAFRPSRTDVALHAKFAYPLDGAHRAVPCALCHTELQRPPVKESSLLLAKATAAPLKFHDDRRQCAECHTDPHAGQFAARPRGNDCASCHGVDAFRPLKTFDHDRDTKFALAGKHARVACAECHKPQPGPGGKPLVIYKTAPSQCEACHKGEKRS